MNTTTIFRRLAVRNLSLIGVLLAMASAGYADDGIDPAHRFSWAENAGWQNWRTTQGAAATDLRFLSGYVWSENLGWIKLGNGNGPYANTSASDWGVNIDAGALSGYAWSETAGWISFSTAQASASIDRQTGLFSGYAWSENLGWIHLGGMAIDTTDYNVRTLFTFLRGTVLVIR